MGLFPRLLFALMLERGAGCRSQEKVGVSSCACLAGPGYFYVEAELGYVRVNCG
jgi:hypothetical protein